MTKALCYYRVSTDLQKDEGTIEIQQTKVREFAKRSDYEIIGEFSDNGVSGGLRDRAGLNQLLEALPQSTATCIIIYKLDRLARDLYIQEGLIKEINKYEKTIVSVLEPNLDGDDPFRKAFRQMLGVFSEFEKAMIALRLEGGRERRARQGGWHGGNIFGYSNKDGALEIEPQEAEIVKIIYELRSKKITLRKIAKHLNDLHCSTKRHTKWQGATVRKILNNPIYKTGKFIYKGILHDSPTTPIII